MVQNHKKLCCALTLALAAVFALLPLYGSVGEKAIAAQQPSNTAVIYNGLLRDIADPPITKGGAVYISLNDFAALTGGDTAWSVKTHSATYTAAGKHATVKPGDTEMEINYDKVTAPSPVLSCNGHLYVPAVFFCRAFGMSAEYDRELGAIKIKDKSAQYSVYDTAKAAYTAAIKADKTKRTRELTTAQAVDLIVSRNAALNDAKANKPLLERRKKTIDEAVDKMRPSGMEYSDYYDLYFLHDNTSKPYYTSDEVDLLRNQQKINNQIDSIGLTEKSIREAAKTQVVSLYIDIEKAFADIYLAGERLAYDEKQLETAKLKVSIGYEGQSAVIGLESTVAKDRLSVEQLDAKLVSAKSALCEPLGLSADTTIALTDFRIDDVKYNADYTAYAALRIDISPSIALRTAEYKYAQYEETSYNLLLSEDEKPYRKSDEVKRDIEIQNENAVSSAKAALADAKDSVVGAAISRVRSIATLSQNKDSLSLDYNAAKRTYDSAVTNYLAGNIAYTDVDSARLQLFSAEASLYQNSLSLRAAVEAYRNIY